MEGITVQTIIEATGGQLLWGDLSAKISGITTNSRDCGEGMLFIPIKGNTFDGHDFIRAAFDCGAAAAIADRETDAVLGKTIILVPNTLTALADIARHYRARFDIPIAAVTGSVGKTTTKDMLASALAASGNVLKTQGNFNNEIGLPLTLFKLDRSHDMAVLEMGMNHFGEIHNLASIAKPNVAVITNIGMSHIEHLGSQEGILQAKLEVIDFFGEDGLLILNGDDPMLWAKRGSLPCAAVYYGIENAECTYRAENIQKSDSGVRFDVVIAGEKYDVSVPVPGEHNVYNALAAIAVARRFGADTELAIRGIANFSASGMRMDISKSGGVTVINDCYNASPSSMEAALKVLADTAAERRIAILGDILEMGDFAPDAHRGVGKAVCDCGIDSLIVTGENGVYIAEGAKAAGMSDESIWWFEDNKGINAFLANYINTDDAILIKASRGMKFEQITECITGINIARAYKRTGG